MKHYVTNEFAPTPWTGTRRINHKHYSDYKIHTINQRKRSIKSILAPPKKLTTRQAKKRKQEKPIFVSPTAPSSYQFHAPLIIFDLSWIWTLQQKHCRGESRAGKQGEQAKALFARWPWMQGGQIARRCFSLLASPNTNLSPYTLRTSPLYGLILQVTPSWGSSICSSFTVIYPIMCKQCASAHYAEQTNQSLHKRINVHKPDIRDHSTQRIFQFPMAFCCKSESHSSLL